MELELVRDVLDKQLVDRCCTKMGRIDGVVLKVEEGKPPQVDHFELGFRVLAQRIHPRLAEVADKIRRKLNVRKTAVQIVQWSVVGEINNDHVAIDIEAYQTPAFDWERWLRDHIVKHLPGGNSDA